MWTGRFEETVLAWRFASKGVQGWVVDFGSRKPWRFRDGTLLLEKSPMFIRLLLLINVISSLWNFLCQSEASGLNASRK